jgi:hypothetical protein
MIKTKKSIYGSPPPFLFTHDCDTWEIGNGFGTSITLPFLNGSANQKRTADGPNIPFGEKTFMLRFQRF